jgi:DNA-binding PadR family transcriptional regulator
MKSVMHIDKKLVKSKAFLSLNASAIKVLMLFMLRRVMSQTGPRRGKEKWIIVNNGEIVFPYAEAKKKFGLNPSTFARAIDKLVEHGFIDIAHTGGGLMGDCTKYAISDRWKEFGTDRFKSQSRPKDTRGLGFTPDNWEERSGKTRKVKSKAGSDIDSRTSTKFDIGSSLYRPPPPNKLVGEESKHKPN